MNRPECRGQGAEGVRARKMMHGIATSVENIGRLSDLTATMVRLEDFDKVLRALQRGESGAVDGAWGSSSALAAATISREGPGTVLVVLAHPGDLSHWADELTSFGEARPEIFPSDESWGRAGRHHHDPDRNQRLRVLQGLQSERPPQVVLTSIGALQQPVPRKEDLQRQSRQLKVGDNLDLDELSAWLVERGYQRVDAVEYPAEFSRRGGILDVFSPNAEAPFRLEFFGDDVESIRQFSVQSQRSLRDLTAISVLGITDSHEVESKLRGNLIDYLPADTRIILVEPQEIHEQGRLFLDRAPDPVGLFNINGVLEQLLRFPNVTISALPQTTVETTCRLRVESVERFSGDVSKVRDELDAVGGREQVLIACQNEAECRRLGEVLGSGKLAEAGQLKLVMGCVRSGFRLIDAGVLVLGSQELFLRDVAPGFASSGPEIKRRIESRAIDSFLELREGDLVVHVSHGIARYHGMHMLDRAAQQTELDRRGQHVKEEHLLLEFRDGVFVYVPASKIDLVQKYVGSSQANPELSKFGGTSWSKRKERVEAAVLDLASEMLDLQAVRQSQPGFAYGPDSDWQLEFEASFPFRETPDQLSSLAEIKNDLQRPRPMDRLLCGDVGYGKTELAVRAAFKAIDNGKQVAVLVPTTVLAEQHYRTFMQRFAEFPFTVECLSRFRTPKEQRRVVESLAAGGVDVVIGTHRLVSADVKFKDLGLVIIDEEQRFGVEHKEKLKQMRATVHVLTLSATPIPRTLHLSLLGIRDISNLETPPPDRLPIETRITRFDKTLIRHAILRELSREGQVYFVHNRVQNIHEIANQVREIVPEARVVVGHGQMAGHELEEAMVKFVRREADILVATTIIESGLDIPNANTMFINLADTYGLADLHQLRGRVGRHKHRAYAYLLLDSDKMITPNAARRLKAIEEFTELGAGFKIAMRDLEIRGAGNILGTQQSGHIAAVGYEMYCQLLENAVRTLRNQPVKTHLEVTIDLPWPAYLPRDYVPGQKLRIEVYRRLARIRNLKKLADFRQELRDRFGPPPMETEWMLKLGELRLLAARWQVGQIHRDQQDIVLAYRNRKQIERLAARSEGRLRVVDEATAYFRLAPAEDAADALYPLLRHLLRLPNETV